MATEIDDNEPVPKLTTKLRSEIMPPEPFEYSVLKPAEPIVEPENKGEDTTGLEPAKTSIEPEDEERFEETIESDTPKVQERKLQTQTTGKSKRITKSPKSEGTSISKLHSDLRKHSEARKKTDLAILDIKKELKELLLVHHATIKDLQKQVTQMHRKIATIESSRKSTTHYKIKKATPKKTANSKKSKNKSTQKRTKKR
jgi:hypothetical protein